MNDTTDRDSPNILNFSVIVDGTQDVSDDEQQSICVRYVDEDFNVHEDLPGLTL